MRIARKSDLTGIEHTMEIPADPEKLRNFLAGNMPGLIQNVFPELNSDEREFLITGITPDEWNNLIATEEDSDIGDHAGEEE